MNILEYIFIQASYIYDYMWMMFLLFILGIIYGLYRQQCIYKNMLRENDSKLSLLKKKLALKMKAEQNQNKIFLSEMMAVQKSFNSFIDRNELTFSELQLNQVVKICSNSLNIYTRIWSKL